MTTTADKCSATNPCVGLGHAMLRPEGGDGAGIEFLWSIGKNPRPLGCAYRRSSRPGDVILMNYCPWCGADLRAPWPAGVELAAEAEKHQ